MLKLRGMAPLLIGVASSLGLVGCARELTLEPTVSPTEVVVAQFDPTNSIDVLRLVPSPTALAERIPGPGLNVIPADCEKPSPKSCLALFDKWPTDFPITLFFSGDIDPASVTSGIKLVKAPDLTTFIDYDFEIRPRTPIPDACLEGDNDAETPRPIGANEIPPGVEVVLTPKMPLDPSSQYIVYVVSNDSTGLRDDLDGEMGAGKRVEPSNLFALMNVDESNPPVADGKINSALLRSNLQSLVIASRFPGRRYEELTDAQKAEVEAAVNMNVPALTGLYGFFNETIKALVAAGVNRQDLVFANTWRTSAQTPPPAVTVAFDPQNQVVPFPNVELLTTATMSMGRPDVRVSLPINPCTMPGQTGCDSPTAQALKGGLNTLNGFSTTASISVSFTAAIDPASLAGNVLMYPLNDQNQIMGDPVALEFGTVAEANGSMTLTMRPVNPLQQNTNYVIVLKRGILDTEGNEVGRNDTFNLLTADMPLVSGGMVNTEVTVNRGGADVPVATLLQCSGLSDPEVGRLLTDQEVLQTATALELQLMRERWHVGLDAVAGAPTPIMQSDVLMVWTYKTQDITGTLDLVKGMLLPQAWEAQRQGAMLPRVAGPIFELEGRAAIAAFAETNFGLCRRLCEGGLTPPIQPGNCTDGMGATLPAVLNHQTCQTFQTLLLGRLSAIRAFTITNYIATSGNPFVAGTFSRQRLIQPRLEQNVFYVISPTGTSSLSAPAVIFQHGLGGSAQDGFVIANTFANAGYATVLMDLPFHGDRASDIVNAMGVPCPAVAPEAVMCDPATGVCMGGCDGQQDPAGTGFLSANVFAARDNFRQAVIDHLTLLRAIQQESDPGEPLEMLDSSTVAYAGLSLGGITGGNFIAYAPEVEAAVLNVPGGGLVNVLLGTVPQISAPLFAALAAAGVCELNQPGNPASGCRDTPAFRQFQVIAQWALDPGDPLANSIGVLGSHNGIPPFGADDVLIQMAVPDLVVPNPTTIDLGEAYGFDPDDNGPDSHFQTFTFPGGRNCHGFLLDVTGANCITAPQPAPLCSVLGAQAQVARFIASGGEVIGPRTVTIPPLCP